MIPLELENLSRTRLKILPLNTTLCETHLRRHLHASVHNAHHVRAEILRHEPRDQRRRRRRQLRELDDRRVPRRDRARLYIPVVSLPETRVEEQERTNGPKVQKMGKLNGPIINTTPLGSLRISGRMGPYVKSNGGRSGFVHLYTFLYASTASPIVAVSSNLQRRTSHSVTSHVGAVVYFLRTCQTRMLAGRGRRAGRRGAPCGGLRRGGRAARAARAGIRGSRACAGRVLFSARRKSGQKQSQNSSCLCERDESTYGLDIVHRGIECWSGHRVETG